MSVKAREVMLRGRLYDPVDPADAVQSNEETLGQPGRTDRT